MSISQLFYGENMKKKFLFSWIGFVSFFVLLFTSCPVTTNSIDTKGIQYGDPVIKGEEIIDFAPFPSRTENLDFIFGTESLAEITLQINRSEWDKQLAHFDKNPKHEECIHADFEITKGDYTWRIYDIGMRIRGNTSRIRPQQGKKYYQAHFSIKFEEWLSDDDDERKLANSMKGIILKRFKEDPMYVREVFGYNFFRKNGVWTAPRAGYTRLFVVILEKDGTTTKLDYGIYAMIEEINKQMLKERSEASGGSFNGNKGNLWKCTWQSYKAPSFAKDYDIQKSFGVEDVKLDDSKSKRFDYDLKTNKTELEIARTELIDFIEDLNALSTVEEIKNFYESKMDVDLFLKTYACNVLLGMDDDYWCNNNNFYFYFDADSKNASGKNYFIPYDYDNCLGTNCFSGHDTVNRNPLQWDINNRSAPLIEKALSVPEYKEIYKNYLLSIGEEESFVAESQAEIVRLQNLIRYYTATKDITYTDTFRYIKDNTARWCSNYGKYKLLSSDPKNNYFIIKARSIKKYCE